MRMKSIGKLRHPVLMGLVFMLMSSLFMAGIGSASTLIGAEGGMELNAAASPAAAIVDDFEQTGSLAASSVSAKSASIGLVSRPETIRYGYHATKLAYDFTDMGGTSAAYVNFKDPAAVLGERFRAIRSRLAYGCIAKGTPIGFALKFRMRQAARPRLICRLLPDTI